MITQTTSQKKTTTTKIKTKSKIIINIISRYYLIRQLKKEN